VSLISERASFLETFIHKLFLLRFRFKRERRPPRLADMRLDQNFKGFKEIRDLLGGFPHFSDREGSHSEKLGCGPFTLILRQEGKSMVTSKLIYKIKHAADGNIEMYKA
jgi:hypothetical protein